MSLEIIKKPIDIAKAEIGYLEKKSNANLDDKAANAGSKNYTKYARDLYPSLQAQPWCDMFVDWCFVKAFGMVDARRLLGGFSAYTPTSAAYFKNQGRYFKTPEIGDQIFFKNNIRINHTGIVVDLTGSTVVTIEGNTSSGASVIPNGGGVYQKAYPLTHKNIDGYGRPDWSLVEVIKYPVGWNQDHNGWWYADSETTYLKDCWKDINNHRYYFNQDGYALKDWREIDTKWYYFEPRTGHPLECALYISNAAGEQEIGEFG